MNILQIFAALRQGATLRNPAAWANSTAAASIVGGLILSAVTVAKWAGYEIPASPETIDQIAAGLVAFVGLVAPLLHLAANPAAGLPPTSGPVQPGGPGLPGTSPARADSASGGGRGVQDPLADLQLPQRGEQ